MSVVTAERGARPPRDRRTQRTVLEVEIELGSRRPRRRGTQIDSHRERSTTRKPENAPPAQLRQ